MSGDGGGAGGTRRGETQAEEDEHSDKATQVWAIIDATGACAVPMDKRGKR